MHALHEISTRRSKWCAPIVAVCLSLATLSASGGAHAQRAFDEADAAIEALTGAIAADDRKAMLDVLGTRYEDRLVTADWGAEKAARERIAATAKQKTRAVAVEDGRVEWLFGAEEWPFPFQAVRAKDGKWRFDTEGGIEAVIDRRIGRNELTAIAIVNAYVDAQIEYAKQDHDGDGVLEYAQRLASTPGEFDGLYWETAPGEPESPFGPLVRGAESYLQHVAGGDPLRGYYFRVLDRQGANPPGGAYDYVTNGNMIAGFALVAYPAVHGTTGVMSFVVNHRGEIQQKSVANIEEMATYDPDDSWNVIAVKP